MACLRGCESCPWQWLDGRPSDPRPHRPRPQASAKGELEGDVSGRNEAGSRWGQGSAHHMGSWGRGLRGDCSSVVGLPPGGTVSHSRQYWQPASGPKAFPELPKHTFKKFGSEIWKANSKTANAKCLIKHTQNASLCQLH